jgi:hypothetical protein
MKTSCVISTMCSLNLEYQRINPTTQVALLSDCVDTCKSSIESIRWNIYQGVNDSTTNIVRWAEFNHTNSSQDLHFYGENI